MTTKRKEEWEKIQRKGMKYNIRPNTYDLESQEYGIGYCKNGSEFYFDKEDYEKIKDYKWSINSGYIYNAKNKILLHHLVLNYDKKCGMIPDHINRKKYDNRKENLRLVPYVYNCINCSIQSNNTSGFIGISWDKSVNKWQVNIRVDKKLIKIGKYKDIEDAKISRLKAELKYFGNEIAPQRHLFEEYNIF